MSAVIFSHLIVVVALGAIHRYAEINAACMNEQKLRALNFKTCMTEAKGTLIDDWIVN